jgi:hypothetical protein
MLLTYDRFDVAKRTLESVAANLKHSGPIWMHIADDGSSQEYRDALLDIAHKCYGENVSITNSERTGYGGNFNVASKMVHHIADVILPLEDDWQMVRELNVDPIVTVLREGHFNCVRMAYLGYLKDLWGIFRHHEWLHWLEFAPNSPEQHVFTGGPRLETAEFEQAIGPWPENIDQGDTEISVCTRPVSRQKVAWPVDLIKPGGDLFKHIGQFKAGFPEKPSSAFLKKHSAAKQAVT